EVSTGIADGERDALPEAIVAPPVIGLDDDACLDQEGSKLGVVVFGKGRCQPLPVRASPPQTIARGDLARYAPPLQVFDGRCSRAQIAPIKGIGRLQHLAVPRHFRLAL